RSGRAGARSRADAPRAGAAHLGLRAEIPGPEHRGSLRRRNLAQPRRRGGGAAYVPGVRGSRRRVAEAERPRAALAARELSGHVDRLHVHELADSEARQLAAVAGLLDAAERQARVGAHEGVHEARAGLELVARDALAAGAVAGEDRGAQPERREVREPD